MKRIFKFFMTFTMILLIGVFSAISGFAVEDLAVNGHKGLKKGDTFSYELHLSDCKKGIVGLQMYISYDKKYLDVVKGSLVFPEMPDVVSNYDDKCILFNRTNINALGDFSEDKVLASVDFKVKKGGETSVTYFVEELYGEDLENIESYTFTYNIITNDNKVVDGEVPSVCNDPEFINGKQGEFINYADGKGAENGGTDPTRETIVGETRSRQSYETSFFSNEFKENLGVYITVIVVILLICGIVILTIIKNAKKREINQEKDKKKKEQNNR